MWEYLTQPRKQSKTTKLIAPYWTGIGSKEDIRKSFEVIGQPYNSLTMIIQNIVDQAILQHEDTEYIRMLKDRLIPNLCKDILTVSTGELYERELAKVNEENQCLKDRLAKLEAPIIANIPDKFTKFESKKDAMPGPSDDGAQFPLEKSYEAKFEDDTVRRILEKLDFLNTNTTDLKIRLDRYHRETGGAINSCNRIMNEVQSTISRPDFIPSRASSGNLPIANKTPAMHSQPSISGASTSSSGKSCPSGKKSRNWAHNLC